MIDGKNFFDQPINSDLKTYENIRKIATGQGDNDTTGCLLDYSYFKDHDKMIAVDLSKQQVFQADPRAIEQINFMANLDRARNTTMLFITEEAKETVLNFNNVLYYWRSKRNCFDLFTRNRKSVVNAKCNLIFIKIK